MAAAPNRIQSRWRGQSIGTLLAVTMVCTCSHVQASPRPHEKMRRIISLPRRQISTEDPNWFFVSLDHVEKYSEQYQENDPADDPHLPEEVLANFVLVRWFRAGRSFVIGHLYLQLQRVPQQENPADEDTIHYATILTEF